MEQTAQMASPEVMEDVDDEESVILIDNDQIKDSLENSEEQIDMSEEIPSREEEADDLIVTFCKRPKLLPHARYDCTMYPFKRAERETSAPFRRNAETCSECYCYICSRPAVECKDWVAPSLCHCNAHNKSQYWKKQLAFALTGGLAIFKLEPSEIDEDMKRGGVLLQQFVHDVTVEYNRYLMGEEVFSDCHECLCHRNLGPGQCDFCALHPPIIYRYTPVSDLVTGFLDQAAKENPKAEIIALLGAAREIMLHKDPASCSRNVDPAASLNKAVKCLMERITRQLQRLLVMNDLPKRLHKKLTNFYRSIPFPDHCAEFAKSLDFFPWDHDLLTLVFKGKIKMARQLAREKKETLLEAFPVVEARVETMETRKQAPPLTGISLCHPIDPRRRDSYRYKELSRYLKRVGCYDYKRMRELRDRIPFYLCKSGIMVNAAQALFSYYPETCCAACGLSPLQFEAYLKIFHTGQVPSGRDLEDCSTPWSPAGRHLKLHAFIIWAVKVLNKNPALYKNPKCWSALIRTFSSRHDLDPNGQLIMETVEEPTHHFQKTVLAESWQLLRNIDTLSRKDFSFRGYFCKKRTCTPASLIFVAKAAQQMILEEYQSLTSCLDIILAFETNFWALEILLDSLSQQDKMALNIVLARTVNDLHCRQEEMMTLWTWRGPHYVERLLMFFLSSWNPNLFSCGLAVIQIIQANLHQCRWAKEVGLFLEEPINLTHYRSSSDVLDFIEAARALP